MPVDALILHELERIAGHGAVYHAIGRKAERHDDKRQIFTRLCAFMDKLKEYRHDEDEPRRARERGVCADKAARYELAAAQKEEAQ